MRQVPSFFVSLAVLMLCSMTIAAEPSRFPPGDDFGAGITLREATPLAEVVAHPERFEGAPVVVRGRITDVCQRKGCWTVITDDATAVRVRFEDYGFFLPKDSAGRDAIAEGFVKVEALSEGTLRHYAAESASNEGDPAEINGPRRIVGFTATGVRLLVGN